MMYFDIIDVSSIIALACGIGVVLEYRSSPETFSMPFFVVYFCVGLFFAGIGVGANYQREIAKQDSVELDED